MLPCEILLISMFVFISTYALVIRDLSYLKKFINSYFVFKSMSNIFSASDASFDYTDRYLFIFQVNTFV